MWLSSTPVCRSTYGVINPDGKGGATSEAVRTDETPIDEVDLFEVTRPV